MLTTLAIECDKLTDDLSSIEKLTVECWHCDPDNPLPIPREKCPDCQGTGRSPIHLATVMKEIRLSQTKTSDKSNEEFLEY